MIYFRNVCIGSDHGGVTLKNEIVDWINSQCFEFVDVGCSIDSGIVDYPDIARLVSSFVIKNEQSYGILICRSGIGMCMASNRFLGIRAVVCENVNTAYIARKHNNANIICLGSSSSDITRSISYIETFLNTKFEGGRHINRILKIDKNSPKTTLL